MFVYKGSCHCGVVQFEIHKSNAIDTLIECNCSICTKKGILHTPVEDDELLIISGDDKLALYQFGSKIARYTFCSTCGCNPFHRSRGNQYRYSVNARCLDDVAELLAINNVWFINGKDHPFDRNSEQFETLLTPYRAQEGPLPSKVTRR